MDHQFEVSSEQDISTEWDLNPHAPAIKGRLLKRVHICTLNKEKGFLYGCQSTIAAQFMLFIQL